MIARRTLALVPVLSASLVLQAGAQDPPQPDTLPPKIDSAAPQRDTTIEQAIANLVRGVKPPDVSPPANGIVWLVDDYPVVLARLAELDGSGGAFPIVRSTSSLLWSSADSGDAIRALIPQLQFTRNTAIPYSRNDGGLWAGRGWSSRIAGGVAVKRGILRLIIAPEITTTQNDSFPPRTGAIIPSPAIPPGRSSFSYPWYANGPYSLDMPVRFGNSPRRLLRPGQSSALADFGAVTFGFSTENEWWGPGIDNALVLSNNAPGFPHLLVRSSRPIETVAGKIEFRWLVGGLRQSAFFDTATNRGGRSLASAVITIRPRHLDDLSLGVARSVVGTSTGWGEIPFRWLDVLRNTGHPNDGAPYDSTLRVGGRDQLYSFLARWAFPGSGAEVYGEWGRLDFPRNLRDLLVQPNRGHAYTLGLQWTREGFRPASRLHFRIENTSLEQSLATRNRFAGVWYTSRRVLQGFTNEGEVLGAAVGPGSSGQVVELNYFDKLGLFGVEFGRTRYNEDVHQASTMEEYLRWCSHDVALQWGVRGGVSSRFGTLSMRYLFQNRLNAWFQGGHGCPRSDGMVDIRNSNVTINLSPGLRF